MLQFTRLIIVGISSALVLAVMLIMGWPLPRSFALVIPISLLLMFLLMDRYKRGRISILILGLFFLIFPFSLNEFARVGFGFGEFPIQMLLLPIITLITLGQIFLSPRSNRKRFLLKNAIGIEFILILLLFCAMLLSVTWSDDFQMSIIEVIQIGLFIFTFFVLSIAISNKILWQRFTWLYIVSTVAVLTLALYYFQVEPINRIRLIVSENRSSNLTGFEAEFAVIALFGLLLTAVHLRLQALYLLLLALILMPLLLSLSRSTWISLTIGFISFVILAFRKIQIRGLIFLALGFILVTVAAFSVSDLQTTLLLERFQSIFSNDTVSQLGLATSNQNRVAIIEAFLDLIENDPFLGTGIGTLLSLNLPRIDATHPHNSFISLWVGAGLFALIILILFFAVHGYNLWKSRNYLNEGEPWGDIMFATYLTMLVHLMMADFFFGHIFWTLIAFQGAAIYIASRRGRKLNILEVKSPRSLSSGNII